jgi:hypothetical protein
MLRLSASEAKREAVLKLHLQSWPVDRIFKQLKPLGHTIWSVRRAIKRFRETGGIADQKKSGRPRSVRTKAMIKKVYMRVRRNAQIKPRRMAAQLGVSDSSARRAIKQDLGLQPFKRRKCQHIPPSKEQERLDRAKHLLAKHANHRILFSDEKVWTIEEHFNRQNDRIYSASLENAQSHKAYFITRQQKPASVMVWAGISKEGKMDLVFLENGRVNAQKYIDSVLDASVKPHADAHFRGKSWIFQQDGAPAHRANLTHEWLDENVPAYIDRNNWPAYSCDLNPCDYYLWGRMESLVNMQQFDTVESLKRAIKDSWRALDNAEVSRACNQFGTRLQAVVAAGGKAFPKEWID